MTAPATALDITPAQVHDTAVKALLEYQKVTTRTPIEASAKDAVKSYNERRKAATAALKPALEALNAAFKTGTVSGCASMKDWCKQVNVLSYARVRQIITGKSGNENKTKMVKSLDPSTPVELKEGMLVRVAGKVYTLGNRQEVFPLRSSDNQLVLTIDVNMVKTDPTPPTAVPYTPDFLSPEEHDALFAACDGLPFSITKTRWGRDVLHSSMTFGPEGYKMRSGYNGDFSLLKDAPDAIKMLQQKLSAYAGKTIDYLSIVRYRDGNDGMTWHQHSEDRHGQDMSVWIVRTGTERTLSIRRKGEKGRGTATHMMMAKGSLAVLPSDFNDSHEHAVLKYKGAGMCYSINCKVLPTIVPPAEPRKPRVYDCHSGKKYPKDAVYVGCRNDRGGREGTIFGNGTNPLISHQGALDIDAFREYAKAKMKDPEFAAQVHALRGKDLLCWCKQNIDGENCHARVILALANGWAV